MDSLHRDPLVLISQKVAAGGPSHLVCFLSTFVNHRVIANEDEVIRVIPIDLNNFSYGYLPTNPREVFFQKLINNATRITLS